MAISSKPTGQAVQVTRVHVRPILSKEESEWDALMSRLHPLGNAQFSGHRIKYVAECGERAVALLCFSASAYHVADRDRWIGWSQEQAMRRRHFVVQNSRFLVLLGDPPKNLASRVLSRCLRRLPEDWRQRFGFAPALAETFVDPVHYRGTCYQAAGWTRVGRTRGFRRDGQEFYRQDSTPKDIWVKPLRADVREVLRVEALPEELRPFEKALPRQRVVARLGYEGLRSLFAALQQIDDPRGGQGRLYPLPYCLAIVVCAVLAGCQGVRECAEFAAALSQKQREGMGAWRHPRTGRYEAPKYVALWRIVQRIDAEQFERTVSHWFRDGKRVPEALAIDGKVLRATLHNEDGGLAAVSAVSHPGTPLFSLRSSLPQRVRSSPEPKS
jgi:hypothetical protein